ncbi:MAG: protease inhibitor I42 family protein [Acidobacteriota bacterium]|nr:protease inhibitor I42 family protein [Acidobacteriota bacterium]
MTIKLKAQLGTGYGWQVVKSKQFKSLGNPELESPSKGSPGGIERQVFQFKALTSGLLELELHYLRPWEKGAKPLKTYRLLVQVN